MEIKIITTHPILVAKGQWGIYQVIAHYSDGHINSKSYECFTPVEATRRYLMEFGRVMGKVEVIFQKPLDKSKEKWYNRYTKKERNR